MEEFEGRAQNHDDTEVSRCDSALDATLLSPDISQPPRFATELTRGSLTDLTGPLPTARKEPAKETAPAQFCQPQQRCLTALCGHVPVPIALTPLEPVPHFPARLMPRPRLRIRYDR